MMPYLKKHLFWICTIAAFCLAPVAQAELSAFEKLVAEREAERAAAREATAKQPVLTQDEVNRLALAIPQIQTTLEELDLPELNKEQSKKMSMAALSGNPTVTMGKLLGDTEAFKTLDQQATKAGYEGFSHYAAHFDIAYGVLTAGQWINMARSMVRPGEEKPEPISNLWAYIHDAANPAAEREKLSAQLDEMLPRFGTKRENAEVIYKNFATLKPLVAPESEK